jgi:hypothetical protein
LFIHDDNRFNKVDYSVPDDSDCVLLLHCDEGIGTDGGTIYDASGKGHDATITDLTGWSDTSFRGEAGTCPDYELANTDYLTVADHADFSFAGDVPFSIEAWIRPESTNHGVIVSKYGTNQEEYIFAINASNNLYLNLYELAAPVNVIGQTADDALSNTTWYHVVATYNGSKLNSGIILYVNGVAVDSTGGGTYSGMTAGTEDVYIGRYNNGWYFDGLIDEVRIHRRELSANEVAARYRSEPYLHDIYQATRVYNKLHRWKGLPIINNGLIKIGFPDYGTYETRTANVLLAEIFAWYENSWHSLGIISPYIDYTADTFLVATANSSTWEITELTDQSCTLRITYWDDNSDLTEGSGFDIYYTIRNGYPGVLIEIDDRDFYKQDWLGWAFYKYDIYGQGTSPEFAYIPEDIILNGTVEAAASNNASSAIDDNWMILFDNRHDSNAPQFNRIIGLFNDDMNDDLGTAATFYIYYANNAWYRTLVPSGKRGGVFFVPYDVDDLFREADSDEADVTTDSALNDVITLGGYTGDGYIHIDPGDTYAQWQVDSGTNLPKGSYIAIARVASDATPNYQMNVDNDNDRDGDLATEQKTIAVANTWQYDFLHFYTDGTNDVYISCERTVGGTNIYVDHWYCIPLSNSIDYPSNLAHQGTRQINLTRGIKK